MEKLFKLSIVSGMELDPGDAAVRGECCESVKSPEISLLLLLDKETVSK